MSRPWTVPELERAARTMRAARPLLALMLTSEHAPSAPGSAPRAPGGAARPPDGPAPTGAATEGPQRLQPAGPGPRPRGSGPVSSTQRTSVPRAPPGAGGARAPQAR